MFDKDQKIRPEDSETIIGAGVKVEGTFTAVGDVVVKGHVTGSVETQTNLQLKAGGVIEADIKAKNASIAGELKGNVDVGDKVELAATAQLLGDITCRVLSIEEGATLNGRCSVGGRPKPEGEE